MTDRGKVIKGLEYHLKELTVGKTCFECPYCGDNPCEIQLIADAIALLKEQEPGKVFHAKDRSINETYGKTGFCPQCNQLVVWGVNRRYCGFCGKGLIWDARPEDSYRRTGKM